MITKEDFVAWRQSPVTQAVMDAVEKQIFDRASMLAASAGVDSLSDRFRVGEITAYRAIYGTEWDDVSPVEESTDA